MTKLRMVLVKYLDRVADAGIAQLLKAVPIVQIDGARGAGKTTTARRFAASELSLPRDLELLHSDPEGVLSRLARPALVDEWQLAGTDVLWVLKDLVDRDPAPGQFILTGSVEPEAYGQTYPLTGRGARVVLRPMTQREIEGRGARSLWLETATGVGSGPMMPAESTESLLVRMVRSGFPSAFPLRDARPWLSAYIESVASRSVDERRDPGRVLRVLRVLAELEARVVPAERIWDAADINRETLGRYDRMLQRTHVIVAAEPWMGSRLKRVTSYPKRYFADAGLAMAVARVAPNQLLVDPMLAGHYFDSFVAAQLRTEVDAAGASMYHLRTKGGAREIDVVIEIDGRLIAVETKFTTRPIKTDAKHLRWFREQYEDRVAATLLVHRGTQDYQIAEGVRAIPVQSLWM